MILSESNVKRFYGENCCGQLIINFYRKLMGWKDFYDYFAKGEVFGEISSLSTSL